MHRLNSLMPAHVEEAALTDDSREFSEEVYMELRRQAQRLMQGEREDHTLTPTALVHEAWHKLSGAVALYRNGKFGEALAVLEGVKQHDQATIFLDLARIHVLAKQPVGGPARARTAMKEDWSRAFLTRMEKDPGWPSWIE